MLIIRPAAIADIADLGSLERVCFSDPWSDDALLHDLTENRSAHYLVARLPDGRLAGYVAWWQILDEAEIVNLAVAPDLRGRGIGRQLMDSLLEQTRFEGAKGIRLEVREANRPARRLYEQTGFEQIGLRKNYYADNGENAITMLKKLS